MATTTADTLRQAIARAGRILAFTGAGVSAESGIPTFRGQGGLWRQFRAEELATPQAFARDPQLVWEWYDWRRAIIAKALPNPAHHALAQLEQLKPGFTLITQNVDGLHDEAGSKRILKLHGDIWLLRCTRCRREWTDRRAPLPQLPPRCPHCNSLARPGVVWFGEALNPDTLARAERAASEAQVFLSIGTASVVYPAAGLIDIARRGGASIAEINPAETPYSKSVDWPLRGAAGEVLPTLVPR